MTSVILTAVSGAHAGRGFWWDVGRPADAAVEPLRAVIFDIDGALAELERDGQRPAFNAAFTAHGLDIRWTVEDYGRLVAIRDERRRIASALRRTGSAGRARRWPPMCIRPRTTSSRSRCSRVTSRRAPAWTIW